MSKFKKWYIKYRLHLLVWALYISYEYLMIAIVMHDYGTFVGYVAHYIALISLFYFHADVLLFNTLQNKFSAAWKLPLALTLEVTAFIIVTFYTDYLLIYLHWIRDGKPLYPDYLYILRNIYRGVYFIGFSTGYYFLITYTKERNISAQIEKQRLNEIILRQKTEQELINAQNAFLKAQINPHFLFNTLDFIYQQIMELSAPAADAVIALAEMMRYAIDADKMGETIILDEEIHQVLNLVYLNQVRKSETLPFHFTYPSDISDLRFVPLVLLTLAENIFKHGLITSDHPARLQVAVQEEMLVIKSTNQMNTVYRNATSQTGLANIEKRLKFAYGENLFFQFGPDGSRKFEVIIKVPLLLLDGDVRPQPVLINNYKE